MVRTARGFVALAVTALVAALVLAVKPASTAPATRTIPVFVFAGQSNMAGYRATPSELSSIDASLLSPTPSVLFWGPTSDAPERWSPMTAVTEAAQSCCAAGFGPEVSAARMLARTQGVVGVVKLAVNGSSLRLDWNPAHRGRLFDALVHRARTAVASLPGARVEGVVWMQGESDADDPAAAPVYADNLRALVASLRAELGDVPVVLGRIANAGPYTAVVRDAQARVAATTPRVALVETGDVDRVARDPLHLSSRGTVELGLRFAGALKAF